MCARSINRRAIEFSLILFNKKKGETMEYNSSIAVCKYALCASVTKKKRKPNKTKRAKRLVSNDERRSICLLICLNCGKKSEEKLTGCN